MSNSFFNTPFRGVSGQLILINIVVFIGSYLLLGNEVFNYETGDYDSMGRMYLASFLPGSTHFEPFQIATHMFMHGGLMHLLFNMLGIYWFGTMVEMVWGPQRFLFYYLSCGIGAWAIHMGVQYWELQQMGVDPSTWNGAMLGASGAVFGIMVAFAVNFPNLEIRMLFPPIALKAKYFVPIMALAELFFGIGGVSTGIAHFAHLGGAITGFILIAYWKNFRF
ncbi:MAG: rhomboid family intramembrane serine protease [Chitinophagales bacterium]|nr:rhomboid family intramembrane serine protease [Chitinophagales bacterium]